MRSLGYGKSLGVDCVDGEVALHAQQSGLINRPMDIFLSFTVSGWPILVLLKELAHGPHPFGWFLFFFLCDREGDTQTVKDSDMETSTF
jgi:hypothetical protein